MASTESHKKIRYSKGKIIRLLPIERPLGLIRQFYIIFKSDHRDGVPKFHPRYAFTYAVKRALIFHPIRQ